MSDGLISVVIPTIGRATLAATRSSLKYQTYTEFEEIIVKDTERWGAPWARNEGAKIANGEFLFFLDDDVILDRTCFDRMVKALRQEDDSVAFAYCSYDRVGSVDGLVRSRQFNAGLLRQGNYISTMSLIRKEAYDKTAGWDDSLKRFQDWSLWLELVDLGYSGVFVNETLFTAYYFGECITTLGSQDIREAVDTVVRKHGL